MAATSIGSGHALAQQIYRRGVIHQAEIQSLFMQLVGDEDDACVNLVDDFGRTRGATITEKFSPTRTTSPFLEGDTIEGNEESIDFSTFSWSIGYCGFAMALQGQMSQQRTNANLWKTILTKLPIKWERHWNTVGFNNLCGSQAANSSTNKYLGGFNTVFSIDSSHIIRPASVSADESLTSAHKMSLDLIDQVLTNVSTSDTQDYPIAPGSSGYYLLIMHVDQARQLRLDTGDTGWRDITRAKLEGGLKFEDSELERMFLGIYGNTILLASPYIGKGVNSSTGAAVSNTRRAVLLGADACHMGFGETYTGGDHLDLTEQIRNFKTRGILADSVFGIQSTEWPNLSGTTQSYGKYILTTYSAI